MNILIIGDFPESTRLRMRGCFSEEHSLIIADRKSCDAALGNAEVIIPEHIRVNCALLAKAPKLRLVQTGAGFDNVDIKACSERGITVCNAAGINSNAVAEHTLALILAWYKNIPYLDSYMKSGSRETELHYSGAELRGKTVGIIGLGAIGMKTATLCRAFGMRVLGFNHSPKSADGIERVSLDRLLSESDVVSLHIPSTPETYHMIGKAELNRMKDSAVLVNTSRGAVIDELALVAALSRREIAGACLDVFETEPLPHDSALRTLPNVILTPHTAGLPDGAGFQKARYEFFAENITKFQNGTTPENILR